MVQRSRADYEAMNAQLLEDLPQLYQLSLSIINDTLCRLVRILLNFYASAAEAASHLGQVQFICSANRSAWGKSVCCANRKPTMHVWVLFRVQQISQSRRSASEEDKLVATVL